MIADGENLGDLVQQERERAKREAKAAKRKPGKAQSATERQWPWYLRYVWDKTPVLTDDELRWLAEVTTKAKANGERKQHKWRGGYRMVTRAPSKEEAERLYTLYIAIGTREYELRAQRELAEKRELVARLHRLGAPVPDSLAAIADTKEVDLTLRLKLFDFMDSGP